MAFRQTGKHVISSLKLRENVEPAALQSTGKHDWFSSNMIGLKKRRNAQIGSLVVRKTITIM